VSDTSARPTAAALHIAAPVGQFALCGALPHGKKALADDAVERIGSGKPLLRRSFAKPKIQYGTII